MTLALLAFLALPAFAADAHVYDCRTDNAANGCKAGYLNGLRAQIATDGNVKVIVIPWQYPDSRTFPRIIGVQNLSSGDVDVNPANMVMQWGNGAQIPSSDPDAFIDASEKHANRANLLTQLLDAGLTGGDNNAIAVDSVSPGDSVVSGTNLADERAAIRGNQITASANDRRSEALRRNTLHHDGIAAGVVYFQKPKGKEFKKVYPDYVIVKLGDSTFLF